MDLLGRGVPTRVIYRHCDLEGPEAASFRAETEAYIDAGAQARVIDHLPTKLVVMDRRAALVAVPDLLAGEATFPSSLHVEHPGLAGRLAGVLDEYWEAARPYGTPPRNWSRATPPL